MAVHNCIKQMSFKSIYRSVPYEVQRIISENWFLPSDKDLSVMQALNRMKSLYCITASKAPEILSKLPAELCAWDLLCISSLGIMQ